MKRQKVLKYCEHECLQNVLLLFMFLLTTVLVKNDHIKVRTFFIFIENVLNQTLNAFNANFRRQ